MEGKHLLLSKTNLEGDVEILVKQMWSDPSQVLFGSNHRKGKILVMWEKMFGQRETINKGCILSLAKFPHYHLISPGTSQGCMNHTASWRNKNASGK